MKINLNNKEEEFDDSITLNDIIDVKNYTFKMIITTVNGKLIKRENRNIIINNGDDVHVIHMISGG